uniref:Transmembrane protein 80 n=1 Tax=Oryzias latipes TaxID=8090 RepID=A0A3P9IQT4_ORYLA
MDIDHTFMLKVLNPRNFKVFGVSSCFVNDVCLVGRSVHAGVLSSVPLQLLLRLTSIYFIIYFLFTLGLLVKKSVVLSYPPDALVYDVALLFLLAALEVLHLLCGVKGNLTESGGYILANIIVTAATILLTVYFLVWQTYVMRADVIISGILLAAYGLDGVLAVSTLARFASAYS